MNFNFIESILNIFLYLTGLNINILFKKYFDIGVIFNGIISKIVQKNKAVNETI